MEFQHKSGLMPSAHLSTQDSYICHQSILHFCLTSKGPIQTLENGVKRTRPVSFLLQYEADKSLIGISIRIVVYSPAESLDFRASSSLSV